MANVKSAREKTIQNKFKQKLITLVSALILVLISPFIVTTVEGELVVTMIDVEQGDSFLLEQDGKTALVDCGTKSGGKAVIEELKNKGITRIDYLFGTHPHDDHMGGMLEVINNFEIGTIIIPEVESKKVTSKWYKNLMQKIKENKYNLEYAEQDAVYDLGSAEIKILAPSKGSKSNLNNYSIILKVTHGENDIIMTGDAETPVEKEVIEKYGQELEAEILKVGHHGSDTSTSDEWLETINPEYGLISAGLGNQHDHPIKSTMTKLEKAGVQVYRTDESGTVEINVSANNITFNSNPGDYLSGTELVEREK